MNNQLLMSFTWDEEVKRIYVASVLKKMENEQTPFTKYPKYKIKIAVKNIKSQSELNLFLAKFT